MRVEYLHGIWAQLIPETPQDTIAYEIIRDKFSVLDPDRWSVDSYRKGYWDGKHNFIDKKGFYLRGMTEQIVKFATDNGLKVTWSPYYKTKPDLAKRVATENLTGIDLWDHQRRMTQSLLEFGGGTAEGVTGAGKTESIALLMKLLLDDPETDVILFLVHLVGLADQTKKRLESRSPALKSLCGLMAEGGRPDPHHRIIFSTYQSVLSALGMANNKKKGKPEEDFVKLFSRVTEVIIDECHHASQDDYVKLLEITNGIPVYQFSGTPEVDDQMRDWKVIGVGGPILERVLRPELEAKGIIAKAIACLREFPQLQRKRMDWIPEKQDSDYYVKVLLVDKEGEQEQGLLRIDSKEGMVSPEPGKHAILMEYARDSIILDLDRTLDMLDFCRQCVKMGRRVLVLCERVAQVLYIYGLFKKEFKVTYIHGEHKLKERNASQKEYEDGDVDVLIASSIAGEGFDIKGVGAVALASGGSSLVRLVQYIGRGVRKKDTGGNWVPIFCPVDVRNKYAKDQSIQRLGYLERAQITSELVEGSWADFLKSLDTKLSS